MTASTVSNDRASRWLLNEFWGFDSAPAAQDMETYGKALLTCANGDSDLTEPEREWVLGLAAANAAPDSLIAVLAEYRADDDIEAVLGRSAAVNKSRGALVIDAIKACAADGDLHQDEVATIRRMSKKLGLPDQFVDNCLQLHEEEERLREKRIRLAWPDTQARPL